jgi:hypothetical protein
MTNIFIASLLSLLSFSISASNLVLNCSSHEKNSHFFRVQIYDVVKSDVTISRYNTLADMKARKNTEQKARVSPIVNKSILNGYLEVSSTTYLLEYDSEDTLVINVLGKEYASALHINTDLGQGSLTPLNCVSE